MKLQTGRVSHQILTESLYKRFFRNFKMKAKMAAYSKPAYVHKYEIKYFPAFVVWETHKNILQRTTSLFCFNCVVFFFLARLYGGPCQTVSGIDYTFLVVIWFLFPNTCGLSNFSGSYAETKDRDFFNANIY